MNIYREKKTMMHDSVDATNENSIELFEFERMVYGVEHTFPYQFYHCIERVHLVL